DQTAGDGNTFALSYSRNGIPPSAIRSGGDFPSKDCTYHVVSYLLRSTDARSARNATYRPSGEITGSPKSITSSRRRGEIVSACDGPTTAIPSTTSASAKIQYVLCFLAEKSRRMRAVTAAQAA